MKKNVHITKLWLAGLALLTLLGGGVSQAASITLDWVDSGAWVNSRFGEGHDSSNKDYTAGRVGQQFNNFFVFDLSGVTTPIVSATLRLASPENGYFNSSSQASLGSLGYDLFDVSTPIADLTATSSPFGGSRGIFSDLGTGLSYGSTLLSAANNGTLVDIALNGNALAALNGANGLFALGGRVSSGLNRQLVFANSGLPTDTRQLILETNQPVGQPVGNAVGTPVPEPGTFFLLGSGLIGLAAWRFKKQG